MILSGNTEISADQARHGKSNSHDGASFELQEVHDIAYPPATNSPLTCIQDFEETPMWVAFVTYIGYAVLFIFGHVRDLMRRYGIESSKTSNEDKKLKVSLAVPVPCSLFFLSLCLS